MDLTSGNPRNKMQPVLRRRHRHIYTRLISLCTCFNRPADSETVQGGDRNEGHGCSLFSGSGSLIGSSSRVAAFLRTSQTVHRWKWKTTWERRLGMCCWLKPFFFLTNIQSIMADIIIIIIFIFFFRKITECYDQPRFFSFNLQQCHQHSVALQAHESPQICAFFLLHSLNAVCVSFSCVFCPSFCSNI